MCCDSDTARQQKRSHTLLPPLTESGPAAEELGGRVAGSAAELGHLLRHQAVVSTWSLVASKEGKGREKEREKRGKGEESRLTILMK